MLKRNTITLTLVTLGIVSLLGAQQRTSDHPPPAYDERIYELIDAVSAERIERDIQTLVGFGTRHTRSETESETRGIGAARRWISAEFLNISNACGGCLEVSFQRTIAPGQQADWVWLDADFQPRGTWIGGVRQGDAIPSIAAAAE